MNAVFCIMLLAGVVHAAVSGQAELMQQALLAGAGEAVTLCLSLAGSYAFFGGLMGVLRESGASGVLARTLRAPLSHLFPFEPGEERALEDICLNLSANMLGMGGAATPAGISAMRTIAGVRDEGAAASDAMILFLVINTSSVQLLPTSMIALRAQAGAASPADIVLPTLLATAVSTAAGILACRLFAAGARKQGVTP